MVHRKKLALFLFGIFTADAGAHLSLAFFNIPTSPFGLLEIGVTGNWIVGILSVIVAILLFWYLQKK